MALLEVQRVSMNFGGLAALSHVDLAVEPGTIHGLIGPNGSGKTTLLNVITGFHPPSSGAVLLGGVFRGRRVRAEEQRTRERALETLEYVGLAAFRERLAANLSFGQQRLVELARALAGEPRLLLLDEPAAGLSLPRLDALLALLARIRE